jgi:hypothetical protein
MKLSPSLRVTVGGDSTDAMWVEIQMKAAVLYGEKCDLVARRRVLTKPKLKKEN